MDFPTAVRTCLSKYVTFEGRARRAEYWWFVLFGVLVGVAASILDWMLFGYVVMGPGMSMSMMVWRSPIYHLVMLALFLPHLAAAVRRLHDTDRSGWWYLLIFVPLIGAIILIVWFATRGTQGPNRFGPDPIGPDGYSAASA